MVAAHLEGMLFVGDASPVRSVEHADAAGSDALVPVEARRGCGSHALDGSCHGTRAVHVAPEHASAAHRAIA